MATIKHFIYEETDVEQIKEIQDCVDAYISHISATLDGDVDKGFDIYLDHSPDTMFMIASDFYTSLLQTVANMLKIDISYVWDYVASTSKEQAEEFGANNGVART